MDKVQDAWKLVKIGSLLEKKGTINPKLTPSKEFTYIDITSIDKNQYKIVNPKKIQGKEAPSRARKIVKKNDVIFATTRPNLKNIAIISKEYSNPVASTGFCVLSPKTNLVDSKFLFNFLLTEGIQEQISPFIRGAQYPAISDNNLQNCLIPLPPLPEQKRIVSKLDALFERIDQSIALLEENIKNTEQLLSYSLDAFFDSLKDKYAVKPLLTHVDFIGGSQPPKTKFSYTKKDGYVRLIQIRDYKSDNHIVYIDEKSTKKFCKSDDVMIGRYGPPVFQILRGLEGAYNVALMKAVPDEEIISKDYLYYFLQNGKIQSYIISISQRSAGQSGVNKKALENYDIIIPPTNVQEKVVKKINVVQNNLTKLQEEQEAKLSQLKSLKESILDKAFKGEI